MATVRERIREYAQGRSGPVSSRELTDALGVHNETVRRTLYRMVDSGDLRPSGDGRYVLPEAANVIEVLAQDPGHQDDERDSRSSESVLQDYGRDTPQRTPSYGGGIGVYDPNAPGGVRSWVPKVGQ
jgi:DNA-binding GntR family transcriptional regulator